MTESSIVRENLMNELGYTPYCGHGSCTKEMPRTTWDEKLKQFRCPCGWVSEFPIDFIKRYINKWNK